jgi:hypothetical protein
MVKSYVKSKNTTYKTIDVKHLLHQAIDRVKPEDWQSFIRHVKDEEQKFWDVDFICDEMIDELQPEDWMRSRLSIPTLPINLKKHIEDSLGIKDTVQLQPQETEE